MTPLAVRCILGGMEQTKWTEKQLMAFVKSNGDPAFNARKLKRYRAEGVVEVQVTHPGFSDTDSLYSPEAGPRALAVSRLLKRKRDFRAVRFWLWLEGSAIEIGQLKESIWNLTPFATWQTSSTMQEKRTLAQKLTQRILNRAWESVRDNFVRKMLRQFDSMEEQQWFIGLGTQLLYGIPVDFTRTYLDVHDQDLKGIREEPADIFAHGLQIQRVQFLPKDIAAGLQELSDKQLLSWTKMKAVLFAATTEELELARERSELFGQLFEALDIMGHLSPLLHLMRKFFTRPTMQALIFISLLVLEQNGFSHHIEELNSTVRINLPILKRTLAFREALLLELPTVAKEVPPLPVLGRLLTEGTQQQRDAYLEHMQELYWQNKDAFDAFWQRHPDLKPE